MHRLRNWLALFVCFLPSYVFGQAANNPPVNLPYLIFNPDTTYNGPLISANPNGAQLSAGIDLSNLNGNFTNGSIVLPLISALNPNSEIRWGNSVGGVITSETTTTGGALRFGSSIIALAIPRTTNLFTIEPTKVTAVAPLWTSTATNQSGVNFVNNGQQANYALGSMEFTVSDAVTGYSTTNTHFGFEFIYGKTATGSNGSGSHGGLGVYCSNGVGGGSGTDFMTCGYQLEQPQTGTFNNSGNFSGNNPYVDIVAGITAQTAVGEEVDVTTAAAPAFREGVRIADISSTAHGSTLDAAVDVVSNGVGFNTGIIWGDSAATFPITAAGTLMKVPASTTTILNSWLDFTGFVPPGQPTVGAILLPANMTSAGICWGTTTACPGGGIYSQTATNGAMILFTTGAMFFQQNNGNNVLELIPTSVTAFVDISTDLHYLNTSAVPTLSACGTSPAATAGSSNSAGQFTVGTGGTVTACTVTFSTAYPTTAFCTVSPVSSTITALRVSAQSKTAFTITFAPATASQVFQYTCGGN